MAVVESVGRNKTKAKYKVKFLRFGKTSSVEISEIVEAEDAQMALNIAFDIAEKAKWHVEKVERMNT